MLITILLIGFYCRKARKKSLEKSWEEDEHYRPLKGVLCTSPRSRFELFTSRLSRKSKRLLIDRLLVSEVVDADSDIKGEVRQTNFIGPKFLSDPN